MILLDAWHWIRAGQPYSGLLTKQQAKKVISIQLDDVYERSYATSVLRDESMHDRLAPGTGQAKAKDFVKMVQKAGVDPQVVGVEVVNDNFMKKGVDWVAQYTYDTTTQVLNECWPELLEDK